MRRTPAATTITEPSPTEVDRIKSLLRQVGGPSVQWGAVDVLNVWVVEERAKLDRQMSERLRSASWALVVATGGLVAVTAGLIWATLAA